MNSNLQKLALLPWLNYQRGKEGNPILYIRITIDGKRAELGTVYSIDDKLWDQKKKRLKDRAEDSVTVNTYIDHTINNIRQHFFNIQAVGKSITSSDLKDLHLGIYKVERETSLCDAFQFQIDQMRELVKSDQLSKHTLKHYETSRDKIVAFMKAKYQQKDLPLSKIRMPFAMELDHYLLTVVKISPNTSHTHIKRLKKVMKLAFEMEWITANPIEQFKCKYVDPERDVLTEEEIARLWNKELSISRLSEIRDVFIFCCYTGFGYIETFSFDQDAVFIGIDGERWLSTARDKTGTREGLPLLPIPLEIIERYKSHEICVSQNKLLPVKSNQRYNGYLKELADICGIKKKLTTHLARHTFATTVTLANGVPLESVSKMLGHKSITTTQIYAKVIQKKVSEDMKALKEKMYGSGQNSLMVG